MFIGPSADAIRAMGSKTPARRVAIAAGVPVVPGMQHGARDAEEAREFARSCRFPVLLKAVAGGGGKGMRRVDRDEDLAAGISRCRRAKRSALSATRQIYVEKLIERPRHIEIQLLGDRHGNIIHLGERECSMQRRHQKSHRRIPVAAGGAHPEMRHAMGEAAVRIARAAGYYNAGTVEFLADAGRQLLLPRNEHAAAGGASGHRTRNRARSGAPAAGNRRGRAAAVAAGGYRLARRGHRVPDLRRRSRTITFFRRRDASRISTARSGRAFASIRGVYAGWTVPLEYDPLLAKLAVWAGSREQAVARMIRALDEYHVVGIKTNIGFFRQLMEDRALPARRAAHRTGG